MSSESEHLAAVAKAYEDYCMRPLDSRLVSTADMQEVLRAIPPENVVTR